MTYAEWLQAMVTILQVSDAPGIAAFTALAPRFIEYGELRIQRELDFLATRTTDGTMVTVAASRMVAIPTQFVVIEGVSLITPAATLPTATGATRVPLLRVSRAFCDMTWPTETLTQAPKPFETYYALFNEGDPSDADTDERPLPSAIIVAPTPDRVYSVEFTGTRRLTPLSETNTTTFISLYLPDLFIAATMVIAAGYQRDYGAQSDDPKLATSWETQYQTLRGGAGIEEARKAMAGAGWSAFPPPAVANIPRFGTSPAAMPGPPGDGT